MTPIVLIFVLLVRLVSSFRNDFSFVRKCSINGLNCLHVESGGPIADSSTADRFTIGSSLTVKVKLPTQDRNIVDRFLKETDYIVENVWDKLKITKIAPGNYGLQMSVIPVPSLSIISPEMNIKLSNHKGTLYVDCSKWTFKDGCGKLLVDPTFDNLDLMLSGKLRISNSHTDEENTMEAGKIVAKKRPVGGPQVYVEGSAEYHVSGDMLSYMPQSQMGTLEKVKNLLESRFNDFMQNRMPTKLTKAFKAYAADALKTRDSW